jgi:hypothetical protein
LKFPKQPYSSACDSFLYNNYLNNPNFNPNFNNKSDKIKKLRIRMTARHCQWRCVNAPVTDAFVQKRHWK